MNSELPEPRWDKQYNYHRGGATENSPAGHES